MMQCQPRAETKTNTCTKTPGDKSEITPSLPDKSTVFKRLIAAGRVCLQKYAYHNQQYTNL